MKQTVNAKEMCGTFAVLQMEIVTDAQHFKVVECVGVSPEDRAPLSDALAAGTSVSKHKSPVPYSGVTTG